MEDTRVEEPWVGAIVDCKSEILQVKMVKEPVISTLALEHKISIVIPAYNEEARITPFLESLLEISPPATELIVVSDGNDRTSDIVKSFGESIKLLHFDSRLGKGGAILEGFRAAKGEVIGFVDADGSIPANEVFRLASMVTLDNACVVGSRWCKDSKIIYPEPILNAIAGRFFHYLTFLILGIKAKDTQCGLKFFHKNILQVIAKRITVKSRMIDVALLYHTKLLKKKINEVGIIWAHKDGTRLPIMKSIPLMFATLIGLKVIHSSKRITMQGLVNRVSKDIRFY